MSQRQSGLEFEFLAVQKENGEAITRPIVKELWKAWGKKKGVTTYYDVATKQPVGVKYIDRKGREVIVNTDAGVDVIEFGFMPHATLQECEQDAHVVMRDFMSVASRFGVVLLDLGLQPKTPYHFPDLKSEKIWYRGFPRILRVGHDMFHNIAAHQPCIDVSPEESLDALNTFNALAPCFIALCANSGVGEWEFQTYHEVREKRWDIFAQANNLPQISGIPVKPFSSWEDYLRYNWSIPVLSVHRGKTLHVIPSNPTIAEFLKSNRTWKTMDVLGWGPSSVRPDMSDVNSLNQYIWIQARLKYFFDESRPLKELLTACSRGKAFEYLKKHHTKLYIETRCCASQPWNEKMAWPALLLGLIENLQAAKKVAASKPWSMWRKLRTEAYTRSMEVKELHTPIAQLIEVSTEGLRSRGFGEERYLKPLAVRLARKESPAMRARKEWKALGVERYTRKHCIAL